MGEVSNLSPPKPLADHHDIESFTSGEPSLDDWLRRRAQANQMSGATRSYVVCAGNARVIAYYALASGVVTVADALAASNGICRTHYRSSCWLA